MTSCQFIEGLYGFLSPAVPVFGDPNALTELEAAVVGGLYITEGSHVDNASEGEAATDLLQQRLQQEGVLPDDVTLLDTMSEDQLILCGFEPRAMDAAVDLQHKGNPPFKTTNIASKLAHFRRLAHFNMMVGSGKPTLQLGILTMITVGGTEAHYSAQLFPVEPGLVTKTVWLYRWCSPGPEEEYEEHWRAFDVPTNPSLALPAPVEQALDSMFQPGPEPNQDPMTGYQPASRKRGCEPEEADQQQPYGIVIPDQVFSAESAPQLPAQKRRRNRYWGFDHSSLTNEQLLAIEPYLIQGEVILRLARVYSNGEIFSRINDNHPEAVKTVNVITKRLTHAIENVAQLQGRTVEDLREEILNAKEANGVVHKMKMDVANYSEGQRRYTQGG